MFNELLTDINLRNELSNSLDLFDTIDELSALPERVKITGVATIAEVTEFYKTKTQLITNILKEHMDEFAEDGYRQYKRNN